MGMTCPYELCESQHLTLELADAVPCTIRPGDRIGTLPASKLLGEACLPTARAVIASRAVARIGPDAADLSPTAYMDKI